MTQHEQPEPALHQYMREELEKDMRPLIDVMASAKPDTNTLVFPHPIDIIRAMSEQVRGRTSGKNIADVLFALAKCGMKTTPPSPQTEVEPSNSAGACNRHPDAPHGFDRNASHTADRYVCDCEGWTPVEQEAAVEPVGLNALRGKYGGVLGPFVTLMEAELHANARKGDRPGWLSMSSSTALLEIYWHTAKLSAAVKNNDAAAIREHSADVANMAMMLLDVCGGLDVQPNAESDGLRHHSTRTPGYRAGTELGEK